MHTPNPDYTEFKTKHFYNNGHKTRFTDQREFESFLRTQSWRKTSPCFMEAWEEPEGGEKKLVGVYRNGHKLPLTPEELNEMAQD